MEEKNVDPTIEEVIKDFPEYNSDPTQYVGTKQYWRSVFSDENNRDPELHKKFGKLHTDIVNMVIRFCEENELEDVDGFYVGADGLKDSYGCHEWTSGTDSCARMTKLKRGDDGFWEREEGKFLYEI